MLIVAMMFIVFTKARKQELPEFVTNVPESIAKKADWRKGQVACLVDHQGKILQIGQKIDTDNLILSKNQWGTSYKTYYTKDYAIYCLIKVNRLVGIYSTEGNVMTYPAPLHRLSRVNLIDFAEANPSEPSYNIKFELFRIPCLSMEKNTLGAGDYLVISTNKYYILVAETESKYRTVIQGVFDISIISDEMHMNMLRKAHY